ncbi:hypothetical protein GCM10007416_22230 [Kroppenstedtia guangzhouensis]|uniref:Uncharacterized protein n=1 Tax=Kroppenstedtia guangzhouensis TaxID=1274356 RepID=A0ABQ1GRE0_9BACL|nr:hypothetical protein GCM10007416_22230 [Kroppenstedtia guangzhouensis]
MAATTVTPVAATTMTLPPAVTRETPAVLKAADKTQPNDQEQTQWVCSFDWIERRVLSQRDREQMCLHSDPGETCALWVHSETQERKRPWRDLCPMGA